MLNKKTKALMKVVYNKAIVKDGNCLVSEMDLLSNIPYKTDFNREDLAPSMKSLSNEGYFEVIETEKNGDTYYCITLQQAGYDFSRQIAAEKRQIKMKIILTVAGVILAFFLKQILQAIAG
jgi:outer membrane protein assembly factor BamA